MQETEIQANQDFTLLCYANQPVVCEGGRLYAAHRNFVDLLAHLVTNSPSFRLIVPVVPGDGLTRGFPLDISPDRVIPVRGYSGHFGSLAATIYNARRVRRAVRDARREADRPAVLLSTIPSSMFALQMLLRPRRSCFVGFARGDTRRTLSHFYGDSWRGVISRAIVDFFLRVGRKAQRRGDLFVFGVGEDVLDSLDLRGGPSEVVYPLLHRSEFPDLDAIEPRTSGPVRFLSLGRLSNEKSIREMLVAVRNLQEDGVDFRLTIAGFGPLEDEIVDALRGDLGSCVQFVGSVEPGRAVYDLLLENDVFLLPSKTEGVPRTVAEAVAARRLVLATPVGSIPATFGDGVHYLDSSEPAAIVDGMKWVIENRSRWDEHIEIAFRRAEELTLEVSGQKILMTIRGWLGTKAVS